jgi:hypothetical protein
LNDYKDNIMADVSAWGRELIESRDLDPLYVALAAAPLSPARLDRFLLAYWYFYHPGVAAHAADFIGEKHYWDYLAFAVDNEPRGTERRHFRGQAARDTIDYLRLFGDASELVRSLHAPTFAGVKKKVTALPQCGPWIAFKVADMFDRVAGLPVDFTDCALEMYRDPVKGAALGLYNDQNHPLVPGDLNFAVWFLTREYRDLLAPPLYDRPINLQEVETVLCKYKSHVNKHYPMGKDTIEIREALEAAAEYSTTAVFIRNAMDGEFEND